MQCAIEKPRDLTLRAEVIYLGQYRVIRVRKGGYLLGYYADVAAVQAALTGQGLSLADVEIKE